MWEQLWYQAFLLLRDGRPDRSLDVPLIEENAMHNPNYRYQVRPKLTVRVKKIHRRRWPADPRIWAALVRAKTAAQIRTACNRWATWLYPGWGLQPFPERVAQHAEEFLRIKSDQRYPRSLRPSSDQKRLDHFARGMAGVDAHIGPITAIDLLRRVRHGPRCQCWRCEGKRWQELLRKMPKEVSYTIEPIATVEFKPGGTVTVPLIPLANTSDKKD